MTDFIIPAPAENLRWNERMHSGVYHQVELQ